jgi:hypothetical protein
MASDGTGTLYIPMEEYQEFLRKFSPIPKESFSTYGIPRIENGDLVVDYAFSTECDPADWGTPPPAVTQWKEKK